MEREQALKIVKGQLTDHRYQHTLGVMETAISLAKQYGADEKRQKQLQSFMTMLNFALRMK